MSNGVKEIVFVLDRSGSMGGMETDTIGGFNGLLAKQQKLEGKAYITTVLFDSVNEVLHDHLDINDVEKMTEDQYYARGCTALLDAIGSTIEKMDNIAKHTKPDKVMFVIITDGYENASRKYTKFNIKSMINAHKEMGWEFLFLGANIDSFSEAESLGIDRNRTANYHNDSVGVHTNFKAVERCMSFVRNDVELEECCLEEVESDFNSRQ